MPKYIVKTVVENEYEVECESDTEAEAAVGALDSSYLGPVVMLLRSRISDVRTTHVLNLKGDPVSMDLIRRRRKEALGHE